MINKNNNNLKDIPNFWIDVQTFDGSNIPKAALWDITNIFSGPNWHPFKKNK